MSRVLFDYIIIKRKHQLSMTHWAGCQKNELFIKQNYTMIMNDIDTHSTEHANNNDNNNNNNNNIHT